MCHIICTSWMASVGTSGWIDEPSGLPEAFSNRAERYSLARPSFSRTCELGALLVIRWPSLTLWILFHPNCSHFFKRQHVSLLCLYSNYRIFDSELLCLHSLQGPARINIFSNSREGGLSAKTTYAPVRWFPSVPVLQKCTNLSFNNWQEKTSLSRKDWSSVWRYLDRRWWPGRKRAEFTHIQYSRILPIIVNSPHNPPARQLISYNPSFENSNVYYRCTQQIKASQLNYIDK